MCKEAAASLSPGKRGMMPGYTSTLGGVLGYLQDSGKRPSVPVGETQSWEIPPFPKQPGEKQHKVTSM